MPKLRRQQIGPPEDWSQLELLVGSPEQRLYELLRPAVLFGRSPAERARETGVPRRTVYRQADRFEREGLFSSIDLSPCTCGRILARNWELYGLP